MSRRLPRGVYALGVLLLLVALLGSGLAGEMLSRPLRRVIGPPPSDLGAESVRLPGDLGQARVAGWFAPGRPGQGAVLLLHGVRSDRRQMLERARFLHGTGRAVLLIDLPAHGESAGERITFGLREGEGVRAGLRFLAQTLPGERTAVIGVSLGAASFVLAHAEPAPSAVVLESMYPTIEEAVTDRLRLKAGEAGAWAAPLLLAQLPLRLGISADELRPIDGMGHLTMPVLIAAGTEDRHTTVAETRRIFEAAAEPKALWLVEGAAHVDLYRFDRAAYEQTVFGFVFRYLGGDGSSAR